MRRYAVAVLCAGIGIGLRMALTPLWGHGLPYITSFPAVAVAAWAGGLGPGLVTTALCALAALFFWLPPVWSWTVESGSALAGAGVFVAMGVLISGLSEALHRRRRQIDELVVGLGRAEESGPRLAAIVESSDDAIVSKDLDGIITSWNPAAERMYGYPRDEAVGQPITLVIPPERHAEEVDVLARIRRGEAVDHFETVRLRKDGGRIDISLTVSPIRNRRDQIIGASKIARDVTERKRSEAWVNLLAEAAEALASSLDYETTLAQVARLAVPQMASGCVVDLFDPDGVLQRAAVAHADAEAEALIWELPRRLRRPDDHPLVRVARGGEPLLVEHVTEAMREALSPDPTYGAKVLGPQWLESFIIVPLGLRNTRLGAMTLGIGAGRRYGRRDLGFVEDLARRASQAIENARLYREAETANRRKDEFLAVLSHELRTPLNSVLGWGRMLKDGRVEPPAVPRALEAIVRNAEAQVRLVEDLLDVSRIVSGKMRLDTQPLYPVGVVEGAIESLRPAAGAKAIQLDAVLDRQAGPVVGDPERLRQVAWNLLSNAVKFTPRNGRVHVQLHRANSHVAIVVSDTGQGIPAELLPRVFEPFRQGDSSSTRHHGGLGLGLALVRYLVELHGGTVAAESPGEGLGATFTVSLPLMTHLGPASADSTPTSASRVEVAPGAPGRGRRLAGLCVLAVDDEPDARELVRRLLEHEGAEVRGVGSASDAMEVIGGDWKPDVLLADIEMPDVDGYQLIGMVRSLGRERGGGLPAVALTAYGRGADRIRALASGFQMHVAKPFDPAELITVVASLARRETGG